MTVIQDAQFTHDHRGSGQNLSWRSHKHVHQRIAAYTAGNLVFTDNLFFTWKSTYRILEIKSQFYSVIAL